MVTAKKSTYRGSRKVATDKDLERTVLNKALEKYQPGSF